MKNLTISRVDRAYSPVADLHSVPMIRLFDERDIRFLRAVPGHTAHREAAFRNRRCRIFRGYLRSLWAEFLLAQTELETVQIESPEFHRSLAMAVTRCRFRLGLAMIPAYLCLFRYRWHLGPVGLERVVRRLEAIRGEIRAWIPGIS
jgi:hypothetical protein